MPHASLSHPTRPSLDFRQAQRDVDTREAVSNIAPVLGDPDEPIVVIETRKRNRTIDGRVTGPRRAAADPNTDDWRQALANYADRLEAHVDEFQGDGYTFSDGIRGTSFPVVYNSLEWTLNPGSPYELEFTANLMIGEGTFDTDPIRRRDPTVDESMDVIATVGGEDLPGMRRYVCTREVGMTQYAVYNRQTAENNDIVPDSGTQQRWTVDGTHTGDDATRAAADDALQSLIGQQVTLDTKFPGYSIDGYVTNYESNLEARFGERSHHYSLEFTEGQPAT